MRHSLRKPNIPTVRVTLLWLVTACVFPASLMSIGLVTFNYQREQQQIKADALSTARAMTSVIDLDLAGIQGTLVALSTSPSILTHDFAALNDQAKTALKGQGVLSVVLADRDGQHFVNTFLGTGVALPKTPNPPDMQRIFQTGKPIVTNIFQGAATKKPLLSVTVPVFVNGNVAYFLAGAVPPERFSNLMKKQHLPDQWTGTLLDGNKVVIGRTVDPERFLGRQINQESQKNVEAKLEGSFETVNFAKTPVVIVYSRSVLSNWTVFMNVPRALLTQALFKSLFMIGVMTIFLFALSMALARWISKRVAISVTGLVKPALALGTSDPVEIPLVHFREAQTVGEALVTASKLLARYQNLAMHDALTGLPNRALFDELLHHQLELSKRTRSGLAVMFIDLDGFKAINDTHGHLVGDKLLCMVADRLKNTVRSTDIVARFGGDEFAVALAYAGPQEAKLVAAKLIKELSLSYQINGVAAYVSASIGIATYPESGTDRTVIIGVADQLMYRSKNNGKNQFSIMTQG